MGTGPSTLTPASGGPKRRAVRAGLTSRRGLVRVGAVGTLVAALVGGSVVANAAPERTLQSVDVDLGSDATISSISSDALTMGGSDGSDSGSGSTTSLDPASTADQLPVRVLTSYRLGDRVGTDLSDIEGESGRVEVSVTVQNTTVRPERIDYDANGTQRSQYALVGAPLTVIASAGVGDSALSSVVTEPDQDGESVTNGVLSRSSEGESQVQWAAMLAPPRLATTATFTLVEDTDSFEIPDLDISVQPGLVTDTSIQNLVRSAFSEDAGSTLSLESSTLGLIVEVNGVLNQASTVLDSVRTGLTGTAGDLGRQTIADLESSTGAVSSSLLSVASSINSLEGDISTQLSTTSSALTQQLDETLAGVKEVLGDPATDEGPEAVGIGAGCDVSLPSYPDKMHGKLSIYQQVLQVQARLAALKGASGACGDTVRQSLLEDLGDADVSDCTETSTSATCAIHAARAGVEGQSQALGEFKDDINRFYDSPELADLSSQVTHLNSTVTTALNLAALLGGGGDDSALSGVRTQLSDLDDALEDIQIALQGVDASALGKVFDSVDAIATIAGQQRDSLSQTLSADELGDAADAVTTLLTSVCQVPGVVDGLPEDIRTYLTRTGAGCADVDQLTSTLDSTVSTLRTQLTATRDAWASVAQQATYPDGLDDVADTLSGLVGQVQDARRRLDTVRSTIGGNNGGVNGQLQGLAALVTTLFSPGDLLDEDGTVRLCPGPFVPEHPGDVEPPLNAVNRSLANVACLKDGLAGRVNDKYAAIDSTFDSFDALLGQQITATDQARSRAVADVDGLTEQLATSMGEAGDDISTEAKDAVKSSRQDIEKGSRTFDNALDSGVNDIVDRIGQSVGTANRDVLGAEKQLRDDLQAVLLDLGDPQSGTGGILGALRANASQVDLSTRKVLLATSKASSFAGVRSTALDDVYLQRAQLTRSLQLQQELPALGTDVPSGSRVLTVYSFHLGGTTA